ncbi:hypothetical protein ACIBJF_35595 [Streptomyces sp. NPDC050743]|uniref:hypothetical protein n=1 Tax=Streptomyces sp. NPDC050743 TaxID=3365634 RepID=UPI00379EEA92
MIRRTLKSGILATAAVLAFLPTAAGATTASAAAPRPVPRAATQHHAHLAQHRTGRVHRMRRLTARRAAYRFMQRTPAHRLAAHAAPYRLAARTARSTSSRRRPRRTVVSCPSPAASPPATPRSTSAPARVPATGSSAIAARAPT